ncbi:MAG: repeat domain protein [Verrucomicrobiales bacterium]|nr:repeat domain protein [Verrucomicrobiales bacterium]
MNATHLKVFQSSVRNPRLGILIAFLWVAFPAIGEAKTKVKVEETKLVWPSPPGEPRISYVQSIYRPADAGVKASAFARFGHWLTGSEKGDEPLLKPFGLGLDENDNLCLTDTGANAVCYLDRAKNKWKRWNKIDKLRFASPVAVSKRNGIFFVADSALRSVIGFNENGKLLFQATNKLERPSGIAVASNRFLVTDSKRHCVVAFDLSGRYLSEFGKRGTAGGEFNFPTHISLDAAGNIYVTDSMNSRVQVFDNEGHFKKVVGSIGNSSGHFSRPKGVAADSFGHTYVVDGLFDNVQIFSSEGRLLLNFGEAGGNKGEFWLPNGIVISRRNEIFIADSYNHRLQVFKYVGGL